MKEVAGVDQKLIHRWLREKNESERYRIYFEEIMPRLITLLQSQVEEWQKKKKLGHYDNMILILGHDPAPAILSAMALRPKMLTILHTPDKEKTLNQKLIPFLQREFSRGKWECVTLEATRHEENLKIIHDIVNKNKSMYRHIVCDITGGKKIIAAQLGIMAAIHKVDISYIDGQRYAFGSIPYPGEEIIFLQHHGEMELTEIHAVPYNRLTIRYLSGPDFSLDYILNLKSDSYSSRMQLGNEHDRQQIVKRINEKWKRINDKILCNDSSVHEDFQSIANMIRGALFPPRLIQTLKSLKERELRLILDEETAAIPWELTLALLYEIRIPIIRLPLKDDQFSPPISHIQDQGNDVLLLKGSGEGIPNFDDYFNRITISFTSHSSVRTYEAANREQLRLFLAENPYFRVIAYIGHAQFDGTSAGSGWVCRDGSVFGVEALSVLTQHPPEIIISSACESARGALFSRCSFAYAALRAGCRTYIGTNWLLEVERSTTFLSEMMKGMIETGLSTEESYRAALRSLTKKFGNNDVSLYNYIYYGK